MTIMTMTHDGQITIPQSIRTLLRLEGGDRISFVLLEDGGVVIRPASRTVREVSGMLKRPGQPPVTVEDMNEAIAEHVTRQFGE